MAVSQATTSPIQRPCQMPRSTSVTCCGTRAFMTRLQERLRVHVDARGRRVPIRHEEDEDAAGDGRQPGHHEPDPAALPDAAQHIGHMLRYEGIHDAALRTSSAE